MKKELDQIVKNYEWELVTRAKDKNVNYMGFQK